MTKGEKQAVGVMVLTVSFGLLMIFLTYYTIKRIVHKERYKLVSEAKKDLEFWKSKTELNPKVSDRLIEYWKTVGNKFTVAQMQNSSTQSSYPWSAAYISNLVLRAGFDNFTPKATHAAYTLEAKKHRQEKKKNSFWAYKPSESKTVEIGDILVAGRSGSSPTLDNLTSSTQTHGDIVIDVVKEKGKWVAIVQGGNVSDTVGTKTIKLTDDKKLVKNTNLFAHLKYEK